MSKTRWKDALPELANPSLETAAAHLVGALYGDWDAPRYVAYAAANIRGVRKGLGVPSERVPNVPVEGRDRAALLWDALWEICIVGWHSAKPQRPSTSQEVLAQRLRRAEAALRTYWREAQR